MKNLTQMPVKILILLCFGITIMLSGHAFAAKSGGGSKGGSKSGYVIGGTGPGGGIIFHLTDNGKKGLEVSPQDLDSASWQNGVVIITTNAVKAGINGGLFNTERIISSQGSGFYAALSAANYNGGGYGDWYLPSIGELALIYQNLHLQDLGGFAVEVESYWSSTEIVSHDAFLYNFTNGGIQPFGKNAARGVRAVRAF